jgi:tripartite-type tricarboxylate transporter receptor subunit TctC
VIVENRAGGGGAVGVGAIVGKKPDGYLISMAVESLHRNSYINKLPFDTGKDLTPIIAVSGNLYGSCVRADSPYKTLKDLVNYAKANPGKVKLHGLRRGDQAGTSPWKSLAVKAGNLKLSHVPSKGDQESSAALLGGHVDVISTSAGFLPLVEAGQLRPWRPTPPSGPRNSPTCRPCTSWATASSVRTPTHRYFGPRGCPPTSSRSLHDTPQEGHGRP